MSLEIMTLVLGPIENNTYVIRDRTSGEAAVIDPAIGSQRVLSEIDERGWNVHCIWITHAHFDHIAGAGLIASARTPALPIGLHPLDLPLYHNQGNAREFGLDIQPCPEPTILFEHGQIISLGKSTLEVRFTPGHTPGHVIFYAPQDGVAFCGDVIFRGAIGRTDFPGGNHNQLIASIRTQILTLPPQTRLLCGHGEETTVEDEMRDNPFL